MSSNLLCLADVVITVSHRISRFVFRVIVVIGRALAFGYNRMRFDHLPSIVDASQLAVDAKVQFCADIIVRYRIHCVVESNVMIRMCFAIAPLGHVKAFLPNRQQQTLLLFFKDYPGPFPCGAVGPHPRRIHTPLHGLSLDMIPIEELFALEEVLSHIRYLPLYSRLSFGMASNGRVYDKACILGILKECLVEYGLITIRLYDGRFHVVDYEATADAAEELPCVFDPQYECRQVLLVRHMNILIPAEDKRHYKSIQKPQPVEGLIEDITEPAEIDFSHFAGLCLGHANGSTTADPNVFLYEPIQRAVAYLDASPQQLDVCLGNGESITFKPLRYAFLVRQQNAIPDIAITGGVIGVDSLEYFVCNSFKVDVGLCRESFIYSAPDVIPDSIARNTSRFGYRPDAVTSFKPS